MKGTFPFILAATVLTALVSDVPAESATLGVIGNVSWQSSPGGGNATRLNSGPGGNLIVDALANPFVRIDFAVVASQGDHQGVSQVVYNIVSPEAKAKGYFLDDINPEGNTGAYRADSGYQNFGGPPDLQNISAPAYDTPQPCDVSYSGGWGWHNSGLPHQGNTAGNPGSVIGAADSLPLTWSGDNAPLIPGLQSYARVGVGLGAYVADANDPILAGQTLGFGADVANGIGGGDGSWWFHSLLIDITGWDKQTYTFNINTTAGNVLRSDADLTQPLGGGFRQAVTGEDLLGSQISFNIIPEPAVFSFVLLGAMTLIRRR